MFLNEVKGRQARLMGKDPETMLELTNVSKIYRIGNETTYAVDDVSFKIEKGEFCFLLGTSGSF